MAGKGRRIGCSQATEQLLMLEEPRKNSPPQVPEKIMKKRTKYFQITQLKKA
jgi:hypothetical protein